MTEINFDRYCTEINEEDREYFELPLKKRGLEIRKREYELIKESLLTDRQASKLALINKELEVITRQLECLRMGDVGNSKGLIEADNQQVNVDSGAFDGTFKPRQDGYKVRDVLAIKLVEDNPKLLQMRPGEIKPRLEAASNLFLSGYQDWWRKNPIFKKGTPGRNPK
ncbi:MAG: hypothetical protein HOE45_07550 [Gammaproteobacteria bacterium]|nr:hypothetical protein [Gammaproteobacteria bacterium]MBT5221300.1 hypothetical protein [Gammaproteobacteria bacterium]MBT6574855.1 hypothetical protein [Gammaproteobacteria bacterium]MBT7436877.1 hypothetical protein [Gammaproteobacteria bacterium]